MRNCSAHSMRGSAKRWLLLFHRPPWRISRRCGDWALVARNPRQIVLQDLREAKLYRAIDSNRQLEEVLTDFWFNHFNVFEGKGQPEQLTLASYENDAIRPHVRALSKNLNCGEARHPAMLYYLDNWTSMAAGLFDVGRSRRDRAAFPQFGTAARRIERDYGAS